MIWHVVRSELGSLSDDDRTELEVPRVRLDIASDDDPAALA